MSEFINWLEKRDEKYLEQFVFSKKNNLFVEQTALKVFQGYTGYSDIAMYPDAYEDIINNQWDESSKKQLLSYIGGSAPYRAVTKKDWNFTEQEKDHIVKNKEEYAKAIPQLNDLNDEEIKNIYLPKAMEAAREYYERGSIGGKTMGWLSRQFTRQQRSEPQMMKETMILKDWYWAPIEYTYGGWSPSGRSYVFLVTPKIGPHRGVGNSNLNFQQNNLAPKRNIQGQPVEDEKPASSSAVGTTPPPAGRPGAAPPAGRPGAAPPAAGRPDPNVIDDPFNPRFMPDPDLPKKVADEIERRRIEAQKNRRPPIGAGVPNAGGIPLDPRTGKPQTGVGGVSLLPTEPRKQKTPEEIAKEQNSYLLKNHQNMQVRNLAEKLEDLGHETYHDPKTLGIVVTDPHNNYSFYYLKEKNEKSLLDALKQAYKTIIGFDPD